MDSILLVAFDENCKMIGFLAKNAGEKAQLNVNYLTCPGVGPGESAGPIEMNGSHKELTKGLCSHYTWADINSNHKIPLPPVRATAK